MIYVYCIFLIIATFFGCNLLSVYGEAPKARILIYGVGLLILLNYAPISDALVILIAMGIATILAIVLTVFFVVLTLWILFKMIKGFFCALFNL